MIIGKYALESITTGMYVNPLDVIREYIQNAADAIDNAIDAGNLTLKDSRIIVSIDALQHRLSVEDNGSGIPSSKALSILTDIGNSEKQHTKNRGFRGIGRLSGLSYADRLTFRTTYQGETCGVEVEYDAKQLRFLLSQFESTSLTAEAAVDSICTVRTFSASSTSHFFSVTLEDVSPDSGLLDEEKVYKYLCQTAPVDFDSSIFSWKSVINQEISILTYPIYLHSSTSRRSILKPYSDTLPINKTTGDSDQVSELQFTMLHNGNGEALGTVWYGLSSFKGSIVDQTVKGLRMRVGNVLLGDNQSLNHLFKDSRFNGWVIGEVHIFSPELIPNARRDDFEHNTAYYRLEEQLRTIAIDITQRIRNASVQRNKALNVALKKVEQVTFTVGNELASPTISPSTKGKLTVQIASIRKSLDEIAVKPSEITLRNEAIEKLDILTGRVKGATQFRAINMLPEISASEKGILAKVFRNLMEIYPESEAQQCIDMILSTYSKTIT